MLNRWLCMSFFHVLILGYGVYCTTLNGSEQLIFRNFPTSYLIGTSRIINFPGLPFRFYFYHVKTPFFNYLPFQTKQTVDSCICKQISYLIQDNPSGNSFVYSHDMVFCCKEPFIFPLASDSPWSLPFVTLRFVLIR